jgi:hypothetical protein
MTGLPKIVRDRLGRAPGGASAIDHPDANLLAGYVERSLTSRERSLVLGHLAECAECREQVSAALSNSEAQMAPQGTGLGQGWLRWPALRWGLLVASLVIMGTVALVRQPPAPHMELASRTNVSPPSAALPSDVTVGAAPGKAGRPASRPSQDTTLLKGKSQNDELAMSVKSALSEARPNRKQAAEAELKKEAQSYQGAQAEAFRTSPKAINGGSSTQPSNAFLPQAAPPPAAPMATAPPQGQPAQQSLGALVSPQPQVETSRASEEDKGKSAGDAVGGRVQEPPPAKAARQLADNFAAPPRPQATLARRASPLAASTTTSNALVSSLPTADWTISAAGKVQRSRDGRKSWEELDVDRNVVFRVVFAVGPDVWLGGSKGALYHSTDGGQHWTRVNIATGSTTVADDVIHIEFKDAQHGTVGTAAGDSWTTTDAGQHWQKQ